MKKLFTLLALLTCFIGANAKEVVDAEVDFSKYSDISEWNFPYSWGGSDQAKERLSIQNGCLHFESSEVTLNDEGVETGWLCQFFPIGGVNAEVGTVYTLHYKIKGDHAENVSMLGFGLTPYGQFPITTDWVEGTVDYEAASGDGNILMQCGSYIGSWDIAYLKITHEEREGQRPVEWIEMLTNGDAETPWGELANVRFDDQENNTKICAWGKEKGVNMNAADDGWDPFPATIEEVDGSHVFVVHGKPADTEGDASAWDNQFWIQAPREIKAGEQLKVHFRYKASEAATTNTQIHHHNPSDYQHYQAIGDINFTTEWQEFDQTITWPSENNDASKDSGYSIAFNLNPQNKNAIDFYFDDLSICEMKLDHGYFVAGANTTTGLDYNFDEAIEFTEEDGLLVATVGKENDESTWVNQIMISTVRGNDKAFKAATLKPSGTPENNPEAWLDYAEGSSAKITLPGSGVWKIYIDTKYVAMAFEMIKGTEIAFEEINPNPTEIVINALERQYTESEGQNVEGLPEDMGTDANPWGQPWDNQFWIVSNRTLSTDEVTIVQFKYKATKAAKVTTQLHANPSEYLHYAAIGDVNFTEDWQDFEYKLTVPSQANNMKSIAFNMAEIKEANDYYIKDVVWKLEDGTESLIDQTGTKNFFVKVLGENPHEFGKEDTGINDLKVNTVNNGAIFNIAGQKVDENYKGLVIKSGKKLIQK